jgi:PAS domain S-box-containing protein
MDEAIARRTGSWDEPAWRLLAESVPHIVWVLAADGELLYLNQRGLRYAGPDANFATGAIHPDDRVRTMDRWETAFRATEIFEADCRLRRGDGVYRWHTSRAQPILDDRGRVASWYGTSTDIDDRKALERDLVSSNRRTAEAVNVMTTLQDAAPIGFAFVDCQLTILHLNAELARYLDVPADEQIGRHVPELFPEIWDQLEPIYRRVLEGGETVIDLHLPRTGTGNSAGGEWTASFYPVRFDDDVVGLGVVALDVTRSLAADGFHAAVMSQVTDGVFTQDRNGILTYMNQAASRMLGWPEEALRGKSMHDAVHFQRADGTLVPADQCALLVDGTEHRLVRRDLDVFTRRDGSTFPVAISSMPLRVGTRVEGVSVVFRDLSDPATSTALIRVLIADADEGSNHSIVSLLTRHEGIEVVGVATAAMSAIDQAAQLHPDVIVVDGRLPPLGGLAAMERLKAAAPEARLVLLTDAPGSTIGAASLAAGASGVVDKGRAWLDLAAAVRGAYDGDTTMSHSQLQQVVASARGGRAPGRAEDLTGRERDVLQCLTDGLSNQQAAERLGVTVNTVRNHVQHVLYKLGVHSRLEAVAMAAREGIMDG